MTSRNKREGRYVGHAYGHAMRRQRRFRFRHRVRSALARAFLHGARGRRAGAIVVQLGEQGAR
jgi:hypothetical protein